MKKRLPFAAVITGIVSGLGLMAASAEPIPFESFSRQPDLSSVSMSLEGDMLVAVVADPNDPKERRAAAYWALPDSNDDFDLSKPMPPTAVTPINERSKFYAAYALKQKKSLWFAVQPYTGALRGCGEGKTTGSTNKYIQLVYMGDELIKKIDNLPSGPRKVGESKVMERCFELSGGNTSLVSLLPLSPTDILISRTATDDLNTRYYTRNLKTGAEKFLYKADDVDEFQISSKDGSIYAKSRLEFEDGEWRQFYSLYDPTRDEITKEPALTIEIKDRYTMNVLRRQPGTNTYYVATDKFSDKVQIYAYDVVNDTFSDQPVLAHPEFSISGMIFSQRESDFDTPIGFTYEGAVSKDYWLDPEMASIQSGLEAAYPGKDVSISEWTQDRNRILFSVSSSDMPAAYFLLLDKKKVAIIGLSRPWMDNDSLGKTELIYYTARDGLKIPALLTLPPGYQQGQKVRGAIVHPHGGPWARDYAGFDSSGWTGYFASRGYAVLQPQYRGSEGWGRKLWLAGDNEWGQKMQDDKDDGAAWLVSQGYVDANKIAIHGYSYGGFAAIAASVRPNSPYQCAIAGAGVSNLTKISNSWGSNRIQRTFQGRTVDGMDPMQNTDKVNIPILLYHGDYDVRVPLWHSTDFYNAIKDKEPLSKLVVLKQMGHQSNKWLPEHKAMVLEEIEDYLVNVCGM